MTRASSNKRRKVTFDVSESDSDSDSSVNSENNRIKKSRHKKPSKPVHKFEPPPLDINIKLKSILKNNKSCIYDEPALTSSFLPLHIINAVINAKFGPILEESVEEDSGNSSDESNSLSSDLYLKTKGNLDVEYNTVRQTSRQNSIEEQSRDDWFLSFKDEDDSADELPFINDSKEINEHQNLNLEDSLNSLVEAEILNTNLDTPSLTFDPNLTSNSDNSESSENSEKPKYKKPRRKLKASNHDNSGDTDSEESSEAEPFDSHPEEQQYVDTSELVSKPSFLIYNAHEISYLSYYCDENFDSLLTIPENLSLSSYSDYNNAVVRFPPVVLESFEEDLEENEELSVEASTPNIYPEVNFFDSEDKEHSDTNLDLVQNIPNEEQSLTESNKEEINFSVHTKSGFSSPVIGVFETLSLEQNTTKPITQSETLLEPQAEPAAQDNPQQTVSNKRTSRGHHKSHKKKERVFLAVRLPCDAEEPPLSPTKRNIKPYLKKTRKPIKFTMEHSDNLNCAGEPEVLSPHKRDDIKEKDILIWIYNMIDEPARIDYEFFLKDGCILCKLMNRVNPGCIPEEEITWEGARSKQKNVQNFLIQAEKYGVPKAKLFYPEDLLHLRHIPRVTRCIYALAKLAQEDPALGPDCPQLGDEPSFVQAAKKVEIPGHRDTKEMLSQIASSMQKKDDKKATKHSLYK